MFKDGQASNRYYFDWAATAVPDYDLWPQAGQMPWGNPSSLHAQGRAAKLELEDARKKCAAVLNVPAGSLYFTSGGTEANCIAVHSNLFRKGPGRVVFADTEHPSIRENVKKLEALGKPAGKIAADFFGRVSAETLGEALEKYGDVRFAAIMAVNNETGAVTDMAALRDVCRSRKSPPVHLHCDLVQAVGKIPVDICGWDIDSAAISAHKIGGPVGIGLLYSRKPLETIYAGGAQENKQRPGTENAAAAAAFAACLENRAGGNLSGEHELARRRWQRLIAALEKIARCVLIPHGRGGEAGEFSPYILSAAFKGVPGEVMARALDDAGFAVSTGAACSSASAWRPAGRLALLAFGIDEATSMESIRFSQGHATTDGEIDLLLSAIGEVLKFL